MVIKNKPAPIAESPIGIGIKKVGHARCTFAVDGGSRESERVSPERPRRLPASPAPPRRARPAPPLLRSRGRAPPERDVIVVRPTTAPASSSKPSRSARARALPPDDVIDLGAPRLLRAAPVSRPRHARPSLQRPSYIPNPRLYPGPERARPKAPLKQVDSRGGGEGRGRRRKRAFRRVVPNPRLYQPAVRREPPPAVPRAAWAPPAPTARLDTASHVAFHFSEQRRGPRPGPPAFQAPAPPLVVTLPPVAAAETHRYQPASAHFRLRSLDTESGESTPLAERLSLPAAVPRMEAGNRKSTSPEDCSDGNETLSAPSEFLAEFLSAIMRRQYAEALKYCRLILQYEPHNATARGFYPLLQQKVLAQKRPDAECPRGSSSEEASAPAAAAPPADSHEMMEQGGDSSESEAEEYSRSGDSCRSQSSLELDSSEAPGHSSPSLSPSRRTERTERTDSASAGAWESTGSASRSDTDDNGNAPFTSALPAPPAPCAGDLANDNAEPSGARLNAEASALQRLRAQFTCSIK